MSRVKLLVAALAAALLFPISLATPAHAVPNEDMGNYAQWINGGPFGPDGIYGTQPDPIGKQVFYTQPFRPALFDTQVIDMYMTTGALGAPATTWYRSDMCSASEKTANGDWGPLAANHGGRTLFTNDKVQFKIKNLPYNGQARIICKFKWKPKMGAAYPDLITVYGFQDNFLDGVFINSPVEFQFVDLLTGL